MRANSKYTKVFSVRLQTWSREIEAHSTKGTYYAGGQVLVFANSNPNVLVTISLIDPDGNVVKEKEVR